MQPVFSARPPAGGYVCRGEWPAGRFHWLAHKGTLRPHPAAYPSRTAVGVGCRRGISAEAVVRAVQTVFAENGLDTAAICGVCSIDLKQDEAGLLAACEKTTGRCIFTRRSSCGMWRVTSLPPTSSAPLPAWTMSVSGAALLDAEKLIVQKTARDGVTVAVAAEHWEVRFG